MLDMYLENDRGTGNTMCFWPGVCWGMGAVLHFDTHTLTITLRGFYSVFGHTPDSVRDFISYPQGGALLLTVHVGLKQMFYNINGKVDIYELINNLSKHFSVANNVIECYMLNCLLNSYRREVSGKSRSARNEPERSKGVLDIHQENPRSTYLSIFQIPDESIKK